jgi:hypothetical protein
LHSTFATLKKLGGPWKTLAGLKILAENFGASQNLGGFEQFWRKTLAPHKILVDLKNSCGKFWRLTKFRRI